MAYFVRNESAWHEMTRSPTGMIGSYFYKKGLLLEGLAKAQVGVKTAALQKSIHTSMSVGPAGFIVRVGSDNNIALLHHNGSRPHIITSRPGKTLRFNSHGRIVYAKVVHHPGTRPNRYLTDNLRKVI
jgi:hypothetical protein